jgi:hypothetical protein
MTDSGSAAAQRVAQLAEEFLVRKVLLGESYGRSPADWVRAFASWLAGRLSEPQGEPLHAKIAHIGYLLALKGRCMEADRIWEREQFTGTVTAFRPDDLNEIKALLDEVTVATEPDAPRGSGAGSAPSAEAAEAVAAWEAFGADPQTAPRFRSAMMALRRVVQARGVQGSAPSEAALLLKERDAWRQRAEFAESELQKCERGPRAPSEADDKLVRCLGKIVQVMRLRGAAEDFMLSEIQDYLTIAGYDVPLRSYVDRGAPSAPPAPTVVECERCDGCGWYEGGATIKTTCEKCGGTGVLRSTPEHEGTPPTGA